MKILIRNDKTFYWEKGDFHSLFGVIKENDLQNALSGSIVKSNIDKEFLVLDASFIDLIENIKRGPAIILPKDIGYILSFTGIDKNSICLDAGTGSGVLASFLARFTKKVYSYENNLDFFNLAKKNFEFLNINNIELKNKDVYQEIDETNLDLVVLDLLEPWKALDNVHKSLKSGSFLVCYLPTTNQVYELIKSLNNNFLHEKTIELIEREWSIYPSTRPKSQMIAHTAFLTFLRKI